MSASLSPTARPSWALTCWATDEGIFIEVPFTNGGPSYVQRFLHSEAGLSQALNFLRTRYELVPMAEKDYTKVPVKSGYVCESAGASVMYRRQNKVIQTDEQRAAALNVLRKLGVV
jgi:hypothetical protein